jgi:hypothetical protein
MSIPRWNIRVEFCGCTPGATCYEITDDNGRWVKHTDHVAELAAKEREIERLTAQVERLSRPFSEAEVKEKWPEASLAEAGLANAMTLARLGLRAWTKDSIALTVAIDAARAALAEELQKGQGNESNQ